MDIKTVIKEGESETLEFKESLQLKDKIGETTLAFSNLKGGIIFVGVSDKGKIKGVQIGRKTPTQLVEYIHPVRDIYMYNNKRGQQILSLYHCLKMEEFSNGVKKNTDPQIYPEIRIL